MGLLLFFIGSIFFLGIILVFGEMFNVLNGESEWGFNIN